MKNQKKKAMTPMIFQFGERRADVISRICFGSPPLCDLLMEKPFVAAQCHDARYLLHGHVDISRSSVATFVEMRRSVRRSSTCRSRCS